MRFSRLPIRLQIHVVDFYILCNFLLYLILFKILFHTMLSGMFVDMIDFWHMIFFYECQICCVPVTYTFELKNFLRFYSVAWKLQFYLILQEQQLEQSLSLITLIKFVFTLQSCSSFLYMTIFLKLCIFCPKLKLIEMIYTIVINLFIQILMLPACHS